LQALAAISFAKTTTLTQVDPTLQTLVAAAYDNVLDILENGQLAVPAYTFTPNAHSDADGITSAETLQDNKATYQSAIVTYVSTNYAAFWVALTQAEQDKFEADVGYVVNAVTYDILYGGSYQTIFAADTLVSETGTSAKAATMAAYTELKSLLQADVETSYSTLVGTLLDDLVESIDLGDTPTATNPTLVGSATVQSSYTAIQTAKSSIKSNTTQYITDTFSSLEYDSAKCERDIEYILDAVYYDLTYGGNLETTIAGKAYYSFGTLQIDTNDKQATLGAYGKLKSLAGQIAQNQDVQQLQALTLQVTGPAGSAPAAAGAQLLIQNIINIIDTQTIPTPINPSRTWGDPALAGKSLFLQNQAETIKASVTQYVDDNWAYSVPEVEQLLVAEKLVASVAELISVIEGGPS